ncbi:hypothetical protein Agub_g11891, partial [Astrephomene gubernaculifera]
MTRGQGNRPGFVPGNRASIDGNRPAQDVLPAPARASLLRLRRSILRLPTSWSQESVYARGCGASGSEKLVLQELSAIEKHLALASKSSVFEGRIAAAAVLADEVVAKWLLRLVAAAVRLEPKDMAVDTAYAQGGGRTQPLRGKILENAYIFVAGLLNTAASGDTLSQLPAHVTDFASKLLRMHTLQAASRQLAAVADSLLAALAQAAPAGVEQPQLEGQQQQPRGSAALRHARYHAARTVFAALRLTTAVTLTAGHEAERQYHYELLTSLQDSCVLEHAARLLLLAEEACGKPGEADNQELRKMLLKASGLLGAAYLSTVRASDAFRRVGAVTGGLARYNSLLSGPCLHHAVMVHGLAALCFADGGPTHGLPAELLPCIPISFDGGHQVAASDSEGRAGHREVEVPTVFLHHVRSAVYALIPPRRPAVVSRQAALLIALRTGRLVLASSQVWGKVAAAAAGDTNLHGLMHAKGLRALLPLKDLASFASVTLHAAMGNLRSTRGLWGPEAGSPAWERWVEEAAELWRLAGSFLAPDCMALHLATAAELSNVEELLVWYAGEAALLWTNGVFTPPARPPVWTAAALAGGFLPCLERLMRRAGEDPGSLEAVLLCSLLRDKPWQPLLPLLLYGEERHAAALVVTMGKVLRRRTGLGEHTRLCEVVGGAAVALLRKAFAALPSMRGDADAAADDGTVAACQRMRLLVSCGVCEWLPALVAQTQRPAAWECAEFTEFVASGLVPMLACQCIAARELDTSQSGRSSSSAAVEGCTGATEASAATGIAGSSGGSDDWHRVLLEVDAVALLGACMKPAGTQGLSVGPHTLATCCCIVAAACPQQVRRAAAAAGAATSATLLGAVGPPWSPEVLRWLASGQSGSASGCSREEKGGRRDSGGSTQGEGVSSSSSGGGG